MPTESVDELITELEKLKVQEASVVARLKQARERERRDSSSAGATEGNEEVFRVGDRVRITNRINPPLSRFGRNYRLDRLGAGQFGIGRASCRPGIHGEQALRVVPL